ncbi:hypothetical protein ACFL17_03465 [Pseudomonadota bacterium]
MRVLAVASPKRLGGALKDVPTWKELGYDVVVPNFRSIIGPNGMSAEMVAYWNNVLAQTRKSKIWEKMLSKRQSADIYRNAAESREFIDGQFSQIKKGLMAVSISK